MSTVHEQETYIPLAISHRDLTDLPNELNSPFPSQKTSTSEVSMISARPYARLTTYHDARRERLLIILSVLILSYIVTVAFKSLVYAQAHQEVECADGIDNDGDTVYDCADADCKDAPNCQKDGSPENSDARCSDWVDNDGDGVTDCDDQDCQVETIRACEGSWDHSLKAFNQPKTSLESTENQSNMSSAPAGDPRDLIGQGDDIDGERNDYLCADGIDNDGDGKTDCEDLGCQLDGSVQVCRGAPNMRFSIVGQLAHTYDLSASGDDLSKMDTRVSRLQLRTFGPIPGIENSFYLVSMLAERTPRLTFAMFSVPLGKSRHSIAVNSGAAGLSQAAALSVHKQLLLSRTTVFRAFEQFNSAAIELSGPLNLDNTIQYRLFGAGGSGRFDGNIGGRSVSDNGLNYPWAGGGQIMLNIKGFYSRFDTPFLYTAVPLTIGLIMGGKYDRREQEEFLSSNVQGAIRFWRFVLLGEHYYKYDLAFGSNQQAYHVQTGFLLIPKHFMISADFGEYVAQPFDKAKLEEAGGFSSTLRKPNDERQIRGALHWFFYRDIGVLSALYTERFVKDGQKVGDDYINMKERLAQLVAQYRF